MTTAELKKIAATALQQTLDGYRYHKLTVQEMAELARAITQLSDLYGAPGVPAQGLDDGDSDGA